MWSVNLITLEILAELLLASLQSHTRFYVVFEFLDLLKLILMEIELVGNCC